jgi:hypothetical protein
MLLNSRRRGPLEGKIKSISCPEGVITSRSLIDVVRDSLTDGHLYPVWTTIREQIDKAGDADLLPLVKRLESWWGAVSDVWPRAWDSKPRNSRLLHGAGIRALGVLMEWVHCKIGIGDDSALVSRGRYGDELRLIKTCCSWQDGYWNWGGGAERVAWNQVQNNSAHIVQLAEHLIELYERERVSAAAEEPLTWPPPTPEPSRSRQSQTESS